jgi:hypothetical protein
MVWQSVVKSTLFTTFDISFFNKLINELSNIKQACVLTNNATETECISE